MSDGIYYNQEVTSEDINAIAKDLGNTSFNGFGSEKFGADELNGITRDLVSRGILLSEDRCEPLMSSGSLIISKGTIVFVSGAKKTIQEPVTLQVTPPCYVYALNNAAAGTAELVVSTEEPSDDAIDYVPIAYINGSGAVVDRRIYCEAKLMFPAGNVYYINNVSATVSHTAESLPNGYIWTIDTGIDNFKYLLWKWGNTEASNVVDLSDGNAHAVPQITDRYISSWYLTAQKSGSSVIFMATHSVVGLDFEFEVI